MTTDRPKPPRRWQPGESGNLKGRPKGSGAVAKLRSDIAEHVPSIITRLVESAKAGDIGASRLLLERVCAPLRPVEQATPIQLYPDDTVTMQARSVLAAAADGVLGPTQAAQLLSALASVARVVEIDELAARVGELERLHKAKALHTGEDL